MNASDNATDAFVVVCPPSAPPPASPPDFAHWSVNIPTWFWFVIVWTFLLSCVGVAALVYLVRERRRQHTRVPVNENTMRTLKDVEKRMARSGL